MKRIVTVGLVVVFAGVSASPVLSAWFDKQGQAVQQSGVPAAGNMQELVAKKKAELNGTEWTIQMKQMGGRGKSETDVISFAEDKVTSKNLSALGYSASSFTVRVENDGTVIWETMQSSEKEGNAFWRGDIKDGVMRGVLSKRNKSGSGPDFNFVSVSK